MASLVIRDLDDDVKTKLRIRAAENGRSMEAEARAILAAAVAATRPARGLGSYIRNQFSELGGVDLEVPPVTKQLGWRICRSGHSRHQRHL